MLLTNNNNNSNDEVVHAVSVMNTNDNDEELVVAQAELVVDPEIVLNSTVPYEPSDCGDGDEEEEDDMTTAPEGNNNTKNGNNDAPSNNVEESSPSAGGHQNGQDLSSPVPPSAYINSSNGGSSNRNSKQRKQIMFGLKNFIGLLMAAIIVAVVLVLVLDDGDDKVLTKPTVFNEVDPLQSLRDFVVVTGSPTDDSIGNYHQVAISANGFIVAASRGRIVQLFRRTSTGQYKEEKVLFPPITEKPLLSSTMTMDEDWFGISIAMSSDGTRLAVSSRTAVYVFDIVSDLSNLDQALEFQVQHKIDSDMLQYEVTTVDISGDGKVLVFDHFWEGIVQTYDWDDRWARWEKKLKDFALPAHIERSTNIMSYDRTVALSDTTRDDQMALVGPDERVRFVSYSNYDQNYEWRQFWSNSTVSALNVNGDCRVVGLIQKVEIFCHNSHLVTATVVLPDDDAFETRPVVHSMSLSNAGDVLVVGTPFYSPSKTKKEAGRVSVYKKTDKTLQWEVVEHVIGSSEGEWLGYVPMIMLFEYMFFPSWCSHMSHLPFRLV